MKSKYKDYFSISIGFKRGELSVNSDDTYFVNAYAFLAGKEQLIKRPIFRQNMGAKRYDFITSSYAILKMISDKLLNILKNNKFTGWDTYPIKILDKKGFEIKGYHGLIIPGRCGPIIEDWSEEFIFTPPSGNKRKAWRGLYFDPKTHDGSDFVIPDGTGYIIVKERVKEALEKAKITNIEFRKLTEYVIHYRKGLS